MILFGHLGLGLKMSRPLMGKEPSPLPLKWLLIGTLFPDLIDKPLYYGLRLIQGPDGAALHLISGTRTFGHTALFLLLLAIVAIVTKSRAIAAVSLGVATHLLLDHLGDSIGHAIWPSTDVIQYDERGRNLSLVGLLWPFLGNRLPVNLHRNIIEHARTFVFRPHIWIGEIIGFLFLMRDQGKDQRIWDRLWKRAYSPFRPKSSS